jgi:hypothetical protein
MIYIFGIKISVFGSRKFIGTTLMLLADGECILHARQQMFQIKQLYLRQQ